MATDEEAQERTLFELFVYTEWKQEPEHLKCEPNITQLKVSPSSLFGFLKKKNEWPSDSYYNHINMQLPWLISLSPDGTVVAILQVNVLETRSVKDDFMVPIGRVGVRKDDVPQQRKICWHPDNCIIAVASSHGIIDIYDIYSNHLWTFPLLNEQSSLPPLNNTNPTVFISGLEFITKQQSKQKRDLELITIYSDGSINCYQMVSHDKFPLDHRTSFGISRISCATYCHQYNLIFIATEPEFVNKSFQNTSFAAGLSAWSKNNESPFYEKVFPREDELNIFKASSGKFWTYLQSFKTVQMAVKLKMSPNNQYLASLHCCGTILIWSIPGLRLYRKWTPADSVDHSLSWDMSFCIPVDIEWRNEEEIIVSRKDGTILIHKIDDFEPIFGSQQEPSNGHPRLSAIATFPGFLALECETVSLPATPQESAADEDTINTSSDLLQSTIYMLTDLEKYQPKKKMVKIVQHVFRLLGVKNTTPEQLFYRKLHNNEFEQALQLALDFGIDEDIVYQEQWKTSIVSTDSIELYLDKIANKQWVLNECIKRVPETFEGASALINYCLKITSFENVFRAQSEEISVSLEALKNTNDLTELEQLAISSRIVIIAYEEKLRTYQMILGQTDVENKYNCTEFDTFRNQHYIDSAIAFARSGNGFAVEILMDSHYEELVPFWLVILNNFPETICPSMYSNILPQCDGEGNPLIRKKPVVDKSDWSDNDFFRDFHKSPDLNQLAERLGKPCFNFNSKVFTDWYIFRALHIEEMCQIVDNAIQLLVLGKERHIQGLDDLHRDLLTLEALVYELEIDISYREFSLLTPLQKASVFMQNTSDENFVSNMNKYLFPFFEQLKTNNPGEKLNLLADFIIHTSQTNLKSTINFFLYIINGNLNIIGRPEFLLTLLTKCLYKYEGTDKFSETLELLDEIIEWATLLSAESRDNVLSQLNDLRNEVFAAEKLRHYHLLVPLDEIHHIKDDEASIKSIIEQMAESTRDSWNELMHEELQNYFQDILMLQSIIFNALSIEVFYEVYIRALLNSGLGPCIELASSVLCCRKDDERVKYISYSSSVDLVLEASRKYFNSALQYNDDNMSLAKLCLYIIKDENEAIIEELDLIRGLRYLFDFNIDVIPLQVRESEDKFKWIDRAILKNKKVYKNPQPIYQLADALRVYGTDRLKRQTVITTRLAEVSFDNGDFKRCSEFCFDLIKWNSPTGWKICLQLGQCEKYTALSEKLELVLFASIYCPSSYLQETIKIRQSLMLTASAASKYPAGKANKAEHDLQLEETDGFYILNSVDKCYSVFLNPIDKCKLNRPLHFKFKSSDLNSRLRETHYSFYSTLHEKCKSSDCLTTQTVFQIPHNSYDTAKKIPLISLMEMNGYFQEEHLLKEVTIGLALKFISESTLLTLGYLLSLSDPADSEEFFMNVPESPFIFQLAIYYYSLCSLSYIKDHPVLNTPQKVVSWVYNQSDVKYADLIGKHQSRYTNYMQAQQVVNLQVGVNSERFMKDADYRKDTILGLAMSCDKLNLAIDLAVENNLSVAEVAITHIVSLLFENDEDSLFSSLNNSKFSSILKAEADTIKQRMIGLLPSLDGFNYQKLIMLFSVLTVLDNHNAIHSLTPSEHIELIAMITDLLPDLDYKDLIENHSRVVEALKESLNYNEDDFLKLIKALKKIVALDYNFNDSDIFLEIAVQEFKDKCLSKKSKTDWIEDYHKIFPYLSKIDSSFLKTFIDQTVCSKESALVLDSDTRIKSLNLLLEWCLEANVIRENMDDVLEAICDKVNKLKKIWEYNPDGDSDPINKNIKDHFVLLEHSSKEETSIEILVNCILNPLVTKDDIKRFYKASGITTPLENIIGSLPKKHPTKFDIIMRRILEIGAETPIQQDSFSTNDWGEEEIDFSDKEFLASGSEEESFSMDCDSCPLETEKSESVTENNESENTETVETFSNFKAALNKTSDPQQIFELYSSYNKYALSDKDRTNGMLITLKALMPASGFSKYEICQQIMIESLPNEEMTELVMDNHKEDGIFNLWICLCSNIPSLLMFGKELLQNIQVTELKLYFQMVNNGSTEALTTALVESPKFWEMVEEIGASEANGDIIQKISDVLFKSGFVSEANYLSMKAENIPFPLISFQTSLDYRAFEQGHDSPL